MGFSMEFHHVLLGHRDLFSLVNHEDPKNVLILDLPSSLSYTQTCLQNGF